MSDYNPWAEPQPSQPAGDSSTTNPQPAGQPVRPGDGASAYSQQSAASQSSAPYLQPSASSQPSAAYPPQQQSSAAYPSQQAAPVTGEQPSSGQYALIQPNPTGGNNFAALFDFGFKKFATRSIVKISYVLTFLFALGVWLVPLFLLFMFGALGAGLSSYSGSSGGGMMLVPAFLWLIFGWIPGLLLLIYARMICEFFVLQQQSAESLLKLETRLN